MKVIFMIATATTISSAWAGQKIISFETDYCTNYPEGTRENPKLWRHCCLEHDMFMWAGGSKEERDEADLGLRTCIKETGAVQQAKIMYSAVRAGSYSPVKYPRMKWNNGWPDRPDYQTLTEDDIDSTENELFSGYNFISSEIKTNFINKLHSRRD